MATRMASLELGVPALGTTNDGPPPRLFIVPSTPFKGSKLYHTKPASPLEPSPPSPSTHREIHKTRSRRGSQSKPPKFQPFSPMRPPASSSTMPPPPPSPPNSYDYDPDRPRRTASSPQLIRTRARSGSASSSASLTATEDNYARVRSVLPRPSASTSRFPNAYPPVWTLARPASPTGAEASGTSDTSEENEEEGEGWREGDDLIFVSSRASSSTSMSSGLRGRRGGVGRRKEPETLRMVTTARGQPCAGETETELDEMPVRLPTSRNVNSRPIVVFPLDFVVPFLFQVTRFLSIVPATFGTVYNIYHIFHPTQTSDVKLSSIDFTICALWSILTGFQCLYLTTGLLSRWKAYYATLSTLIRLVALQCICWPATHITLQFFDHTRRPVACWVLIGTTTCLSRSVELWVTSNLYMPVGTGGRSRGDLNSKVLRTEGRLGPRRWDWAEVVVKCALPAGVLYFVTAWGMILKDEVGYK